MIEIKMTYFLITWLLLALFDNGLSVYAISLSKKLPEKNQDIIKNKKNLKVSIVNKFGIIPGFIVIYLLTAAIILIVIYILYKYLDPSIIRIIFILIVVLDLILIFVVHIPKIKKYKSFIETKYL